ncbi:MAG: hypothetical protein ABIB93_08405 [Chloroflexota bacterium]
MNAISVPADGEPDLSRLVINIWRAVAKGSPITGEQEDKIITGLGIPKE